MSYNYKLDLEHIPNNVTNISLDAPVTSINAFAYLAFVALAKAPAPLYSMEHLHDVLMAFESDLYFLTVSRTIFSLYIAQSAFWSTYLDSLGFSAQDIGVLLADPQYGFGDYLTMKIWVQAQVDYENTGAWDDGAFDIIQNHFGLMDKSKLQAIIAPGSLYWELTDGIKADMLWRYGTSELRGLALVQWARTGVTGFMPLDQPPLAPPYYYQSLNGTSFDFLCEINTFLQYMHMSVTDYLPVADHLLAPNYTYPMTNHQSLLNRDNIGALFTFYETENYTSLLSSFGLEAYDQVLPLIEYLYQMGNLEITLPDGSEQYDGYSLALSRLVAKSLVNETVSLKMDTYWGLTTQVLLHLLSKAGESCQSIMSQGTLNPTQQNSLCTNPSVGWNSTNPATWRGLVLWTVAANKTSASQAFAQLTKATGLSAASLSSILYTGGLNLQGFVQQALTYIAKIYCGGQFCTYDQLLFMQWANSTITNTKIVPGMNTSVTMQDWFPDHYRVPIEFFAVTKFQSPLFLTEYVLNYNYFLNPMYLKRFFNSYLARNITDTMDKFHLPSNYTNLLYTYFLRIIPGFGLFATYTVNEWLTGVPDVFLMFLSNMTVYEGGDPSIAALRMIATLTDDQEGTPQNIMYSGKGDASKTRQYYAYYGHHVMDMYWPGYNASAPGASSWVYTEIWNGSRPILGTDGGQFGTRMEKEDTPYVYISSVLRWFQLKYLYSYTYNGVELYRYVMDNALLETAATNPANYYFYQEPGGLKGFMNITTQEPGPVFVNLPHCYACDEAGINMIEYYSYPSDDGTQVQIFPSRETDQPFADVEPESGAGVKLVLLFQSNMGLVKDYFFPDFYEAAPGAPLYHPFYILKRSVNYTEHQVNRILGAMILARKLEVVFRVVGLVLGAVLVLGAFWLVALAVKRQGEDKQEYTEMMEEKRPSVHPSEPAELD